MAEQVIDDKRTYSRVKAPILVRLRGEKGRYREVSDISAGGLRMRTRMPLTNGQWVPVRIYFPDLSEEVEITGRVVWQGAAGEVGLDYRDLDEEDAGLLSIMIGHQKLFKYELN